MAPVTAALGATTGSAALGGTSTLNYTQASTLGFSQTLRPATGPTGKKEVNYSHIIKLFTADYAKDMIERQHNALKKLIGACEDGYHVANLESIAQLLGIVGDRVNAGETELVPYLVEMIALAEKPFSAKKASDMQANLELLSTVTRAIATAVASHNEEVSATAASALTAYARRGRLSQAALAPPRAGDKPTSDTQGVPPRTKKVPISTTDLHVPRVINESGAVDLLLAQLDDASTPYSTRLGCVYTLLEMSLQQDLAGRIVDSRGPAVLVRQLGTNFDLELPSLTIDLLLGVMSMYPSSILQITSPELVQKLVDLAVALLSKGYRVADKELRNDVLLTALLLAGEPSTHEAFYETGFADVILAVAGATELKLSDNPCVRSINNTTSTEDYDMKIILVQLVSRLSAHEGILTQITQLDLIQAFLQFLDMGKTMPCHILKWNPQQLHALQLKVLHFLWRVGPLADLEYEGIGANSVVLQFLLDSVESELRHATLRVLHVTSSIGQSFKTEIGSDLQGVKHMLAIVTDPEEEMETKQLAVAVLSTLCKGSFTNQEVFYACQGVAILVDLLNWQPSTSDAAGQLVFLVNAVDLLWNAVLGNETNETEFLDLEGMHSLLVLVESSPRLMRNQLLGVISDLLENDQALEDYQTWQSAGSRRYAMQVLMDIWNEDERRLCTADPGGVIQDFVRPLGVPTSHVAQPSEHDGDSQGGGGKTIAGHNTARSVYSVGTGATSRSAHTAFAPGDLAGSLAVNDSVSHAIHKAMSPETVAAVYEDDIRSKVYAIFHRCGFDNSEYLDTLDRVRLLKVQNYIPFKEMEIRHETGEELEAANVRPVTPDRERITAIQAELRDHAEAVRDEQVAIRREAHEQDLLDETHHIEEINAKQAALAESQRIQTEKDERVRLRRKDPNYDRVTDRRVVRMQQTSPTYDAPRSRASYVRNQSTALTKVSEEAEEDGDVEHPTYDDALEDTHVPAHDREDVGSAGESDDEEPAPVHAAAGPLAQTAPLGSGKGSGADPLGVTAPVGKYTFASVPGSVQVRDRKRRPREKKSGSDTQEEQAYVTGFLSECHDVPHVDLFHFSGTATT